MEAQIKNRSEAEKNALDGTQVESQAVEQVPRTPPHSLNTKEASDVEDDAYPRFDDMKASKIAVILLSLALASFLYAIEETIVATSVSAIGAGVKAEGSLAWVSTSYLLTATAIQPITGRLADALGRLRFLIIELWVFIIGNIIAGTSKNLPQLVAGRLIAGVGGAGLLSLAIIILSHLTNERQRGSYLNLVNVIFIFADAMGPLVGGGFAKSGHWEWIFLFNAPFGPVITIILLKAIKLPQMPHQRDNPLHAIKTLDLGGMIMLVATLSFFIVGLNIGGQSKPWNSPLVIGMFCAAGVSFILFIAAENRAKEPIAPPRLFVEWKWRNVPLVIVLRTLLFFHLYSMTFYLPVFLQVIGVKPINAAALVIPFLAVAAVSSTITNYVAYKWGHVRPFFLISCAILPVGMGLMSTLDEMATVGKVVGYSLLSGFGFGCCTQIMMVVAQVGLPRDELSTVTALVSSVPNLGGVLGVGIIGNVINNSFRNSLLRVAPSAAGLNLNDVVQLVQSPTLPPGVSQMDILTAFVKAWRIGCLALTGIAVSQLLLSLLLRRVDLDDGKKLDTTENSA